MDSLPPLSHLLFYVAEWGVWIMFLGLALYVLLLFTRTTAFLAMIPCVVGFSMILDFIRGIGFAPDEWGPPPMQSPWLIWPCLVSGVFAVLFGIAGLHVALENRKY